MLCGVKEEKKKKKEIGGKVMEEIREGWSEIGGKREGRGGGCSGEGKRGEGVSCGVKGRKNVLDSGGGR